MPFGKKNTAKRYMSGAKKKKTVKKPKMVKPRDGHSGDMKKAMKFVASVRKAMKAYGK